MKKTINSRMTIHLQSLDKHRKKKKKGKRMKITYHRLSMGNSNRSRMGMRSMWIHQSKISN
jgi:hypothetical protein